MHSNPPKCYPATLAETDFQRSVTVAHMAKIARWRGGRLLWDPVAKRFTNSDKANGHLDRERRKGYELPDV